MYKLCRVNIKNSEKIYKRINIKLKKLSAKIKKKYRIHKIIVFGSYVRQDLNEGSDIDLIIVGDFKEKFHKRIMNILDLTDLPIEPLCYTKEEFVKMIDANNRFIVDVLKEGVEI